MIVVKVGGRALKNAKEIIEDSPKPLVLVHGGGDQVTEYSKRMGVEPRFVVSPSGVRSRYTSWEELQVFVMVMGKINKELVSKFLDAGSKAVGISGVDGPTLIAERKKRIVVKVGDRRRVIKGGYTGRIVEVKIDLIRSLLSAGYSVVVSPIARGKGGEMLNVDGDQAASKLAAALRPDYLILLSDVDGVYLNGEVVRKVDLDEAKELAANVGFGMNRKVMMASEVASKGVEVIIASGLVEKPVTRALNGGGTHIIHYSPGS